VFAVSGLSAGALVGAAFGTLGRLISWSPAATVVSALVLAALGLSDLLGFRPRLLQRDRETPKSWLDRHHLVWALLNGMSLGSGSTTRLGFVAWYWLPLGCLAAGSAGGGAIVWGVYGGVRCVLALAIAIRQATPEDGGRVQRRLLLSYPRARGYSDVALIVFLFAIMVFA